MARPKSDDKRNAIMAAAIRVIAAQGLSAPTATIAQEASVANGSLFNYFPTKADLLNQLYRELKAEMASAALDGLLIESDVRQQVCQMWTSWLRWAVTHPEKRRTLAHLGVSEDITVESHEAASHSFADIRMMLDLSRKGGALQHAALPFVAALMNALAEATVEFMARDPEDADEHCKTSFDALWRMIG